MLRACAPSYSVPGSSPVVQVGPLIHRKKKNLVGFSLTLSVSPASTQPHSKKLDSGLGLDP